MRYFRSEIANDQGPWGQIAGNGSKIMDGMFISNAISEG